MKKNFNLLLLLGVGLVGYYVLVVDQSPRKKLIRWAEDNTQPDERVRVLNIFSSLMSDSEASDTWDYLRNYAIPNVQLPMSNPLYSRIMAISVKYNIFT